MHIDSSRHQALADVSSPQEHHVRKIIQQQIEGGCRLDLHYRQMNQIAVAALYIDVLPSVIVSHRLYKSYCSANQAIFIPFVEPKPKRSIR